MCWYDNIVVWWYDCVKGCALAGGWSCTDYIKGWWWSCSWFGLLVIWLYWFGYVGILILIYSKVWIIKINDKKQYKTIKNNK